MSIHDIEQLLIEVDQLNTCPGFEHQNHMHRSSKCMSYIKGKQTTCINCRFLKSNANKRSTKNTLRNRYTFKINRNLSKKVFFILILRVLLEYKKLMVIIIFNCFNY